MARSHGGSVEPTVTTRARRPRRVPWWVAGGVAVGLVLVAIWTVYYLDVGICDSCGKVPAIAMNPALEATASCGNWSYTYNVSVAPSTSPSHELQTANFAIKVANASGTAVLRVATPAPVPSVSLLRPWHCTDPTRGAWYAVLWNANGFGAEFGNVSGSLGWVTGPPLGLPVNVTSPATIEVVSASNYANDNLEFYGMGGASVSGSVAV